MGRCLSQPCCRRISLSRAQPPAEGLSERVTLGDTLALRETVGDTLALPETVGDTLAVAVADSVALGDVETE